MAFPYMSSDNNDDSFAGTMADQLVVNQTAGAVKNKPEYMGGNK